MYFYCSDCFKIQGHLVPRLRSKNFGESVPFNRVARQCKSSKLPMLINMFASEVQ